MKNPFKKKTSVMDEMSTILLGLGVAALASVAIATVISSPEEKAVENSLEGKLEEDETPTPTVLKRKKKFSVSSENEE